MGERFPVEAEMRNSMMMMMMMMMMIIIIIIYLTANWLTPGGSGYSART